MEPTVFTEAEGEVYDAGALRLRLLPQAPDQPIAVSDNIVPPAVPGPVRHRHPQMTEMFYVLDGNLAFDLAGEQRVLGPGSFVLVPPGVVHTFANPGSAPVRFLEILQPAGNEQFFKEAVQRMAAGHPWSPAEMAEMASRYDFEAVIDEG